MVVICTLGVVVNIAPEHAVCKQQGLMQGISQPALVMQDFQTITGLSVNDGSQHHIQKDTSKHLNKHNISRNFTSVGCEVCEAISAFSLVSSPDPQLWNQSSILPL